MRFWDSSAVVPLCVAEPHSANARSLLEGDPAVAVWWATRTECLSALTRRMREGGLAPAGFRAARRVLAALAETWVELLPSEAVRATAERLLAVHALRAADAFQLGAALAWCGGQPSRHEIVTLDIRLRDAASREGFDALPDGD
jgi:predicted nucleic acid-binding protein